MRQAFVKALISNNFDPKHYIRIEIDVFRNVISGIFSQLILDNLSQYHLIDIFFLKKKIFSKICYETYNGKLLAIFEVFKI